MKHPFALCAASLIAVSAHAETRGLGAHEHGHGALNIAFEGGAVLMELVAPGADIVGFEHPAKSAEDRAAIDAAVATLAKPLDLFIPDAAAGCAVTSAKVELLSDNDAHDEGHGDHEEHGHDNHDHDEKENAEEDHHEEHAHDEHEDEAGHTEFHAEYALTCADPAAISAFNFAYFTRFPNAVELEVQLISAKGAKGFEVERAEPRLDLSGAI